MSTPRAQHVYVLLLFDFWKNGIIYPQVHKWHVLAKKKSIFIQIDVWCGQTVLSQKKTHSTSSKPDRNHPLKFWTTLKKIFFGSKMRFWHYLLRLKNDMFWPKNLLFFQNRRVAVKRFWDQKTPLAPSKPYRNHPLKVWKLWKNRLLRSKCVFFTLPPQA